MGSVLWMNFNKHIYNGNIKVNEICINMNKQLY